MASSRQRKLKLDGALSQAEVPGVVALAAMVLAGVAVAVAVVVADAVAVAVVAAVHAAMAEVAAAVVDLEDTKAVERARLRQKKTKGMFRALTAAVDWVSSMLLELQTKFIFTMELVKL